MTIRSCPPYNGVASGGIKFRAKGKDTTVSEDAQWKMGCALRTKLGLDIVTFTTDSTGRNPSPGFFKFLDANPKELLRTLKKDCVSTVKGELSANEKRHAKPFCASAIKSVEVYLNDTKPSWWQEYKHHIVGFVALVIGFGILVPWVGKRFFGGGSNDSEGKGGGTVNNGHHTHVHGNPIQVVLNNPVPGRYDIKVGEDKHQIDVPEENAPGKAKGDSTVAARVGGLISIMRPSVSSIYRPVSATQAGAVAAKSRSVATTSAKAMTPQQLGTLLIAGMVYLFSRKRAKAPKTAPQRVLVPAH